LSNQQKCKKPRQIQAGLFLCWNRNKRKRAEHDATARFQKLSRLKGIAASRASEHARAMNATLLTLTGFQARIGFANNVYTAFATYHTAVFATFFGRLQRAQNLHGCIPANNLS
jgi:hypothetical protein